MSDIIKNDIPNMCELFTETYSFFASNGDMYIVKPATFREVLSPNSNFIKNIETIGAALLDDSKNQNEVFVSILLNPHTYEYINDLISKYVYKDGKRVTLSDLANNGLNSDDVIALINKLADISGVNIEEVTDNGMFIAHNGEDTMEFLALLIVDTNMSINEIYRHSLPFLSTMLEHVSRIKMIAAGIDPNSNNNGYYSPNRANDEVESTLSDEQFYGQLNALLR